MRWLKLALCLLHDLTRDHMKLLAEILALRQQLSIYRARTKHPRLNWLDRLFWILLSRLWPGWQSALAVVQPETVVRWHRTMFKWYWARKSREKKKPGRPKASREIRQLIARMTRENPTWGAPRIVKELVLLGIKVSESSVHRYRDRSTKPPSQTWRTFLLNHMGGTVAIDRFTVPTVTFSLLYVFIVLSHARRKIVHFNVTSQPCAQWCALQVKQAFPWDTAPRFLLRDNDKVYGKVFSQSMTNMGIEEVRISPYCPWQNPYAERIIGSIRRDCLDHMIILNEDHLYRVLAEYFRCYNESRCHESLDGNAPVPRDAETGDASIRAVPFLGGLHHRYTRAAA